MTKTTDALRAAAEAYGDARHTMETHDGGRQGPIWVAILENYTAATRALMAAARAYADKSRKARTGKAEEPAVL